MPASDDWDALLTRLNWQTEISQEDSLPMIDWDRLSTYAIQVKQSRETGHTCISIPTCQILPIYSLGGLHLVRLLEFDDGDRWIARAQLGPSTELSRARLLNEVQLLDYLHQSSRVPVPAVYGYELNVDEQMGAAMMLQEFIPGSTGMDACGGYHAHHGEIPSRYQAQFAHSLAQIHVDISSVRFNQIGNISRLADGSYGVTAIPGLGGPFDTAAEYLEAWAKQAHFRLSPEQIRTFTPPELVDGLLDSIHRFPNELRAIARQLPLKPGPFPLCHPDLFHSNVIVDGDYKILGVIDWDGATILPWELIEFPLFLSMVPAPMGLPEQYDAAGEPLDEDQRRCRVEQGEYIEHVREYEREIGTDSQLSQILSTRAIQNLATAVKDYTVDAKVGYYCRVLDVFRTEAPDSDRFSSKGS